MPDFDWEQVLFAAAHLQHIVPDAVLTGGSAAAAHAKHRISVDADHVLTNLRERYEQILTDLESVAGWQFSRGKKPVLILGNLDGVDTGIRQLIRDEPLETEKLAIGEGQFITIPTREETLRIKGVLILRRNAYRDYLDFAAMSRLLGEAGVVRAMTPFDRLYPQRPGTSSLQQLLVQLANPLPHDLDAGTRTAMEKHLSPQWQDWQNVAEECVKASLAIATALVLAEKLAPGS